MEQLISNGAQNMGPVFARLFDLAMRIECERFLGADYVIQGEPERRDPDRLIWTLDVRPF